MNQAPFPDLATLILYYSKEKTCLPCPLSLSSVNCEYDEKKSGPAVNQGNRGDAGDSFIDPAYQSLREVRAAMQ